MKIRAHVFFEGRVQGVFFRANAQERARALGLVGWVRNSPDGRVEAVFEGEEELVREAIEWCEREQPYAEVVSATVETSAPTDEYTGFDIVW